MRINQFIASSGICSRRHAETLVGAGRITVNGQIVRDLACTVKTTDQICLDGKPLQTANYQYVCLHKPVGFLTTMQDDRGRSTIYKLLPQKWHHLRPVGRLDCDSSGLLLLSNDGNFIYQLTHPRIKVAKHYLVSVQGKVTTDQLLVLRSGTKLDGQMAYAQAELLAYHQGISLLNIVLHQGINRQIRRMLARLNHPVLTLQRFAHGPFILGKLPEGKFKTLPHAREKLREYLAK